ncbi:MAG: MazG family protein [Chloroflexi bacterium]|nr:MazG family protein [Chloroflexota bacterium]
MAVIVVGLGPGPAELLTLEARRVLESASEVWLRTGQHPAVAHLPGHLRLHSFDHLYESLPTFADVYAGIVEELLRLARRPEGVVYAVPGHPAVGETTVRELRRRCAAEGVDLRLVAGVSFIEPVLEAIGVDPLDAGLRIADGLDEEMDPAVPTLVCQVYSTRVASQLKANLSGLYPDGHELAVVSAAGAPEGGWVEWVTLAEVDRADRFGALTCVYLPPVPMQAGVGSFELLRRIIARLRAPDGCPWDREQTHQSIRRYLVEECYEALEALDEHDMVRFCEELGDLLLQVLLHAQMAAERGDFSARDVMAAIASKLVRRHPHVFGEVIVSGSEDVVRNWEAFKAAERGEDASRLGGVPPGLPALAAARSLQERSGLDPGALLARSALRALGSAEGWGDLLFGLVAAAAREGVDAEEALMAANRRFRRRFDALEALCRERGVALADLQRRRLRRWWRAAAATLA